MNTEVLLVRLKDQPETIAFDEVIAVIDNEYKYTPVAFSNGDMNNDAGQNSGSCKIFGFAQLQGLSEQQTLHCFGDYYRVDVLEHPNADSHQNIRNFMKFGWRGIHFSGVPLMAR